MKNIYKYFFALGLAAILPTAVAQAHAVAGEGMVSTMFHHWTDKTQVIALLILVSAVGIGWLLRSRKQK